MSLTIESSRWKLYKVNLYLLLTSLISCSSSPQCLRFYQSDLHRVKYHFAKYAGNHVNLVDEEEQQGLPPLVFERDQIDAEKAHHTTEVLGRCYKYSM